MRRLLSISTLINSTLLLAMGITLLEGFFATTMSASATLQPSVQAPDEQREALRKQQVRKERQQEFLRKHTDEFSNVRPDLWQHGIEHVKKMRIAPGIRPAAPAGREGLGGGVVGVQWTQIGPAPLVQNSPITSYAGLVTDIAIDPRNTTDQIIYIATDDGGIWKSTDGGASWKPKTDFMPSLSMGAVALDPSNPSIVYAGTGFIHTNDFSHDVPRSFKAIGIYKSIDGGETWCILNPGSCTNTPTAAAENIFNSGINRIVVPAPNVLLVATGAGLYRSEDGGVTFGNNAPDFNNSLAFFAGSFITDLKLDTVFSSTVYAAVLGQGIFRSTDGGRSFPTSDNLFKNSGPSAGTYREVHFAQSTQPDNQTLYATVECRQPPDLFKSTNGGESWTQLAPSGLGGVQCDYDDTVGVDPLNPSRLYVGLVNLFESEDGGMSFTDVTGPVHPDHHAIAFSPLSHLDLFARIFGSPVYVGTDGGIATKTNPFVGFQNINDGLATLQFRQIDIGRSNALNNQFTYGGMQDNGLAVQEPFLGLTLPFPLKPLEWYQPPNCCDGGAIAVDHSHPTQAYFTLNGGVNRTRDGGTTWEFLEVRGKFRLAVDPNNGIIVYATSSAPGDFFRPGPELFWSTDGGVTFVLIHTFPAAIESIGTVAIDSNTLWVGLTDGTVQRTPNALAGAGANWIPLTVTGAPPNQPVGAVAIDPSNTDQVVVVCEGFTSPPNPRALTRHAFLTTNNGRTWTDISGTDGGDPTENLPDLPLHSVVIDPGTSPHTIIVASDATVLRTANLGLTWEVLGVGLPMVYCTSLALDSSVTPSLLRVGTYGRSVFELTSATGPLLAVNADLAFGAIGIGQRERRIVQLFNVGATNLHISSFVRIAGSTDFQIISGPATPVTIMPGEELDYTIQFLPRSPGDQTVTFRINSDDPFNPARQVSASGMGN